MAFVFFVLVNMGDESASSSSSASEDEPCCPAVAIANKLLGKDKYAALRDAFLDEYANNFKKTLDIVSTFADPYAASDPLDDEAACGQGSTAWMKIRAGRISGSRIGSIAGKNKYCKPLSEIANMVFNKSVAPNFHMARGNRLEPLINTAFEKQLGERIYQYQVLLNPDMQHFSYSPDGIGETSSGQRFLVEYKAPMRFYPSIPESYMCQMQFGMWMFQQSKFCKSDGDFTYCHFVQGIENKDGSLQLNHEVVPYNEAYANEIVHESLRVWRESFVPYSILAKEGLINEKLSVIGGTIKIPFQDSIRNCPFYFKK